jgi:cytochrome c oxidase subunit 2
MRAARGCGRLHLQDHNEERMRTMRAGSQSIAVAVALVAFASAGAAYAGFGQPSPWQTGLQQADTTEMNAIIAFNDDLMALIIAIAGLVFALLVIVMVRFNKHVNPTPSKRMGNRPLEVAWTVIPFLVVLVMIYFSFGLLYFEEDIPRADITVKATGHQWYWHYGYPDHGDIKYASEMLPDAARKPGQPRLLAVNNDLVVPVNKIVRVQVIGADVIHSFAVPSFGIKVDAIPGRLNETWFKATRTGMYYGQCSELCGMNHSFMPIAIRVVSDEEFTAWLAYARRQFAARKTPVPPSETATINKGAAE